MVITTQLLKEIATASKTSAFAIDKLENAKKTFNKIKEKVAFDKKY